MVTFLHSSLAFHLLKCSTLKPCLSVLLHGISLLLSSVTVYPCIHVLISCNQPSLGGWCFCVSVRDVYLALLVYQCTLIFESEVCDLNIFLAFFQSDLTRYQDNMFDSLKDWMYRIVGWDRSSGRHGRLLPMWTLVLPTVLHGLLTYVLGTLIQHLVLIKLKGKGIHKSPDTDPTSSDEEPPGPTDMTRTYYPELVANFLAFFIPEFLLYPLETVLNQLYVQGTRTIIDDLDTGTGVVPLCTNYDGMLDCFRSIWRDEGLGGFYKGFGALLIQLFIHWLILKLTQFVYKEISQDFKGK